MGRWRRRVDGGELIVGMDEDGWLWLVSPFGAEVLTQWREPETIADALHLHGLDGDQAAGLLVEVTRARTRLLKGTVTLRGH